MSAVEDIALAWGVSRQYIYKAAKQGCPIKPAPGETIRNLIRRSLIWREENNKQGTRSENDVSSTHAPEHVQEMAKIEHEDVPEGEDSQPHVDVSTIENSLKVAIEIEAKCAEEVKRLKGRPGALMTAINVYNKAQANRMATEKSVMKLQQDRKHLITHDEAKRIINRVWGPFISRLRACPRNAAAMANPQNDTMAEAAIRKEIELAISEGQKAYGNA
jgi:hypothetical protein